LWRLKYQFDGKEKRGRAARGGRPIGRWRMLGDQIHADICRNGFDSELGRFVQPYRSKALDASLLLLPIVGFLPPSDPRIVGTVRAIERRLVVDGLVFRYDTGKTVHRPSGSHYRGGFSADRHIMGPCPKE
jgi:GH15 family glucan-1,4-alpha-glucosidase